MVFEVGESLRVGIAAISSVEAGRQLKYPLVDWRGGFKQGERVERR